MIKPTLLILAAGIGSRYGGLKQADSIGPHGEALIEFAIYDALRSGFGKVAIVIRRSIEKEFMEKFAHKFRNIPVEYAFQEIESPIEGIKKFSDRKKPWGTGHAMLVARHLINEPFLVINADNHYGYTAIRKMGDFLKNECSPTCYGMVSYTLKNALSENGYVSRGVCEVDENEFLIRVTERTKIKRDESTNQIYFFQEDEKSPLSEETVVSMNFWGFHPTIFDLSKSLFIDFMSNNFNDVSAEFYIPAIASTAVESGLAQLKVMTTDDICYDITYQEDKLPVQKALKEMVEKNIYPTKLS